MNTELQQVLKVWERTRPNSPIYEFLLNEVEIYDAEKGIVRARLHVGPRQLNSKGTLHGAFSACVTDWAGGMAIASHGLDSTGVSTDIHVNYLSTATDGDWIEIESRANKVGKSLAFTTVTISKKTEAGLILVAQGSHTKIAMVSSSDDVAASKPAPAPSDLTRSPQLPQPDTASPESIYHTSILKECLDSSLEFLSHASNERLLGVLSLLFIGTYVILGRVGLILIGAALGVILHASWEGPTSANNGDDGLPISTRRPKLALEVSKRLLDWSLHQPSATDNDGNNGNLVAAPEDLTLSDLEFSSFQPLTAAALRSFTDAVINDYVKYWYEPILPEEAVFPESCRRTLTHFVTTISSHLSRKRTEETFLQFLTNSSSIIIVFLNELAAAFATAGSASTETSSIVERYLENAPDSSLANVLSKEQQRKKLNMIADDILSNYLDSKTYRCSPARDFLREVFARVVLESTVISLSRPEFINEWIIYLLQDGESEIMHAIDAGVEGARNQGVSAGKVPNEPKNVPSESATGQTLAQPAERRTGQVDEATEKALREAKRLSALIASQDVENTVPESQPQCRQNTDTSSSDPNNKAELPSKWMPEDQRGDVGVGAISPEPQRPMAPSHREVSVSPVSLHGAQVMVDDDAAGSEKGTVKSKPTWDYLLQVEPTSTRSTGWMVFRKYTDFQSVHEMLETVARLNRIQSFSEQFPTLPAWKGKTRHELARELERYLQEAVKHESLAETNRMRQFLEKERGSNEVDVTTKSGFSFPSQSAFENVGKGVLGALTNAPKGVAGGGRAVFDGVTGVFGGSGHSRKPTNTLDQRSEDQQIASKSEYEVPASFGSAGKPSALESYDHLSALQNGDGSASRSITSPAASATESSRVETHKSSVGEAGNGQDTGFSESTLVQSESRQSTESSIGPARMQDKWFTGRTSPPLPSDTRPSNDFDSTPQSIRRQQQPITADETQIAVELIFAVINELYTLSSAWNIRRTLLNAAKSYILRPASPTLETIRTLLQESMIESHTSDDALSEYLKKLRENALPTEAELLAWPPPATEEEKEQLRIKARRLFVQRGIPQALTSVMGAAASREALEKIFDSLQVQSVAQGFVFSVLLQGLRVLAL